MEGLQATHMRRMYGPHREQAALLQSLAVAHGLRHSQKQQSPHKAGSEALQRYTKVFFLMLPS